MARVLTLSEPEFCLEAEKIISEVKKNKLQPDLVIGITTGGAILAERMKPLLNADFVDVKCQRASTGMKKKFRMKVVLKWLPQFINNNLRILEHHYRQWRASPVCVRQTVVAKKTVTSSIVEASSILIVDDAIDSGSTMSSVIDFVRELNSTAKITTAAITVTWRHPCVLPDIALYENTLIRFHWSDDA